MSDKEINIEAAKLVQALYQNGKSYEEALDLGEIYKKELQLKHELKIAQ